ncbi:metallophosphoesterase [Methylosinus sp. RM1]|uniref:metallophosphoesterase n=1 Tax=Methylosinus sp. RM1 TaxID=2583817 RepID=UPI00351A22B4
MTLILVLSDLHLENRPYWRLPDKLPPFDVAVFAGDIAETPRVAVETLAAAPALSGRPVVYVPGNHELFSGDIDAAIADGRAAAEGTNVRLLDREVAVVAGARFVGAILWTDYALGGDPKRAMEVAAGGMYDHRLIRSGNGAFSPGNALARHQGDLAFIEASLAAPFAGPTVVVTHHAPHPRSVHAKYAQSVLSAAFASDLSETIERGRPACWVHGHCHASSDYRVGATRVVCNPKGNGPRTRGGAVDNGEFREGFVVEV